MLLENRYALIYRVLVSLFFELETIRIIQTLIFTLFTNIHVAISGQCYYYIETIKLICSANGFYTTITLLISDATFSYTIFDFLEDILHSFPQVFNLGRLKITQEQPQTILWQLGNSSIYYLHVPKFTERQYLHPKWLSPIKILSKPCLWSPVITETCEVIFSGW